MSSAVWIVALYMLLDCSNPAIPGLFMFDATSSVKSLCAQRLEMEEEGGTARVTPTSAPAVVVMPRLPAPRPAASIAPVWPARRYLRASLRQPPSAADEPASSSLAI